MDNVERQAALRAFRDNGGREVRISAHQVLGPRGVPTAEFSCGQVSAPEIPVARDPGLDVFMRPGYGPQVVQEQIRQNGLTRRQTSPRHR